MATPTIDDLRAEAARLLSLDEEGQRVELFSRALGILKESDEASARLHKLDKDTLVALLANGNQADTTGVL